MYITYTTLGLITNLNWSQDCTHYPLEIADIELLFIDTFITFQKCYKAHQRLAFLDISEIIYYLSDKKSTIFFYLVMGTCGLSVKICDYKRDVQTIKRFAAIKDIMAIKDIRGH